MLHPIRYICRGELATVIAQALVTHGYTVEIPPQQCASGATTTVMAQGTATVLLVEAPDHVTLEIECSGAAREVTVQLLESLPLPLHKDSDAEAH
jgi:hypothetical protein